VVGPYLQGSGPGTGKLIGAVLRQSRRLGQLHLGRRQPPNYLSLAEQAQLWVKPLISSESHIIA